jgi:hypothetical protein
MRHAARRLPLARTLAGARAYGALPLESRTAIEIMGTERPELSQPRDQYVYYPGGAALPESVTPNIRNRSYTIAAEVETSQKPPATGSSGFK